MIRLSLKITDPGIVAGLAAVAQQMHGRVNELTETVAGKTQAQLKAKAPVGKVVPGGRPPGGLQRSISFDMEGTSAKFTAAGYAGYVIGGTSPHDITGNPLLAFFWERTGDFVVFTKVRHPGTKPNDFRDPALTAAADDASDALAGVFDWVGELL